MMQIQAELRHKSYLQPQNKRMLLLLEISFRGLYYFISDQAYRRFIWLVFRFGGKKRHQAFSTDLFGYKWHVADAVSFIWQFKEIFTDQSYRFHSDRSQKVIYDCGANIGLSCLFYHRYYPEARVEAYEPDPQVSKIAAANISSLNNPNIQLREQAVWIENGVLDFYQNDVDSGSLTAAGDAKVVKVATIDLLEQLQKEDFVDFLKMDIEGAETQLLPHIAPALPKIGALFIEYHSRPSEAQSLSQILGLLQNAGFRYYLKTENRRKQPLLQHGVDKPMDYQTNIYAYRLTKETTL